MQHYNAKGERWAYISGWEHYQISNLGRVRSLQKRKNAKRDKWWKLVRVQEDPSGLAINLWNKGKRWHPLIKNLVTAAFMPRPPVDCELVFLDGNEFNCRLDNLEWQKLQVNVPQSSRDLIIEELRALDWKVPFGGIKAMATKYIVNERQIHRVIKSRGKIWESHESE